MGIDNRFAGVVAQAEDLMQRQYAAYMQAMRERELKRTKWDADEVAKIEFLKAHDASPMDVAAYDTWLVNFVAAGGELTDFVNGDFPRIRLFDEAASDTIAALAQQQGSLEEAYFGEPVIWTIDTQFDPYDIPRLVDSQSLTLHLTQNAVTQLPKSVLEQWAADVAISGDNELYVDGEWINGQWHPEAYTLRAIPYVWQENIANMGWDATNR